MGRLTTWLRVSVGAAAAATLAFFTPGVSSAASVSEASPSGGAITVVGNFNLATVDPGSPSEATGSGSIYYYAIYDGLFVFNDHSQLKPDLATSWEFTAGGDVATIHLRKGVKFSDGTAFNAAAVKYNLDRDKDPKNACACLQNLVEVKSVAAPSPQVVQITLTHPDSSFFTVLASSSGNFIGSPTAIQKEGSAAFGLKPVGAGPFEVESLAANAKLTLTRNPNYWNPQSVHLNTITVVVDTEPASQYDALTAGNAQLMMFADPNSEQQALKDQRFSVVTQPATAWSAIQFNTLTAPFNSILARRAVAAALDPAAINKGVYDNTNIVSNSIFGSGEDLKIGAKVPGGPKYNDPALAKSLLKQLGKPVSFTISALQDPTTEQALTVVQSQLHAVGITMKITDYPRSSYLPVLEEGHYQAFWSGDAGQIDPGAYAGAFFVDRGTFQKELKDSKLAAMVNAAQVATPVSARAADYRKVMEYVNRNYYFVPMWTTPTFDIKVTGLKGLAIGPSVRMNSASLAA